MDSLIITALTVAVRRRGEEEALDAEVYLAFCSEEGGVERLLLSAMYCDGGDEIFTFLRFWDTEKMDPARLAQRIHSMVVKLHFMFVKRQCLTSGFTQHMLQQLKHPRSFSTRAGPMTIGSASGVPHHVVERCLQRMCSWLVLVVATVRAEFPSWQLVQAFCIFDTDPASAIHHGQGCADEALRRLALACRVPHPELARQCALVRPTAIQARRSYVIDQGDWQGQHQVCQGPVDEATVNVRVWAEGLEECEASSGKCPDLREVQVLYHTMVGCTTSGVEHLHTKHKKLLDGHNMDNDSENNLIKVAWDYDEAEEAQVIDLATGIWARLYGRPRQHRKRRKDHGQHRGCKKQSLKAWLQKRRDEMDTAISLSGVSRSSESIQRHAAKRGLDTLPDSLIAELDRQNFLYNTARLESIGEGTLLPTEYGQEDLEAIQVLDEHKLRLRSKRHKATDQRVEALPRDASTRPRVNFASMRVCVENSPGVMGSRPAIGDAVRGARMQLVTVTAVPPADIYIVSRPGTPHADIAMALVVHGGATCDHAFLTSACEKGSYMKYNPLSGGRRFLWISRQFQTRHADAYAVLRAASQKPHCPLKEITHATFVAKKAISLGRPRNLQRPMEVLALVTEAQKATEVYTKNNISKSH